MEMDKDSMKCFLSFLQNSIKEHEKARKDAKRDEDEYEKDFRILYNGGCINAYKSVLNWLENMG